MSSSKKYQLKDQETGFHDPETHLDVTRDQTVEIDTSKGVGKATLRAIKTGGLIEVSRTSKAAAKEEGGDDKKSGAKADNKK